MFLKTFNFINKTFFQYLLIVIITFLLTIFFSKSKNSIFLNLTPPNNSVEIESLINKYLKSNKDKNTIKKLVNKGSFVFPLLFNKMKNNTANKTEYIHLLNYINIKEMSDCNSYNLDCYLNNWEKIKYKYTKQYINKNLGNWLINKKERKKIEEELKIIGKFATPYILNFLVLNNYLNYKESKSLYLITNNIKTPQIFEDDLFENKYLIKEYFSFYHSKYTYYYQSSNITNKIKTIFLTTQFAYWIKSAFSLNFGAINKNSVYKSTLKLFLRTLLVSLLIISISYYFTILIILKIKRKKHLIYKFIDDSLQLLSLIHPLMIIVVFSIILELLNLSNREKVIYYAISLFTITFLILLKVTQSIIIREKSKDNIIALKFYGINEAIIFKKYIYKDITTLLLKKLRNLIIPISFYTIIQEYLLGFNGIGKLFLTSLIEENYEFLRTSILFIGIAIIIIRAYIDLIIFINLNEINKDERNR